MKPSLSRTLLLLALLLAASARAELVDRIAAIVNNEIVTLSEVEKRAAPELAKADQDATGGDRAQKRASVMKRTLDQLIDEKLVDNELRELKVSVNDKDVDNAIDVAADDPIVLAEVDLVILAAPVRQNIELLGELDEYVHQPAVVTDTGSTKRAVVEAARALPPRFTFIGGHPLGGSAKGGLENARPDLFGGRPWLLTPTGESGDALDKRVLAGAAATTPPTGLAVISSTSGACA